MIDKLQRRISVARGILPADLVFRNARLVNVCSDEDILRAARVLEEMGGGFACVVNGEVRACVPLPLGGLVSPLPATELVKQLTELDAAAAASGCVLDHPCMTLSFLSLSVIPSLKLTDRGLVDVETFTLLPLQQG